MDLYGHKMFDWSKINEIPAAERKDKIVEAAAHLIKKISGTPLSHHGIKMVGPDSSLQGMAPIALIFSDTTKSPDRGFEYLFSEVDMRASANASFDVMDITGGATFYQQVNGEEAKLSRLPTAAKTSVGFLRFTGGYNIMDDWLRFNQYYKIDQLTADTIRRWWDNKATTFYGLLSGMTAGINESFATDDVTTINNACAQILTDMAAAGYAVDENERFAIVCNPKLRARIFKALAQTYTIANASANGNQIVYNVDTVISTTKLVNTSYYIAMPGFKSQRGEWDDLNLRPPQRNEMVLGAAHIWTGAYNGIIGEVKQYRRCALS
jgi:hypothetical protein